MKACSCLITAFALLGAACEKKEEKPAPEAAPDKSRRRLPTPPAPSAVEQNKPVRPPNTEELAALLSAFESLANEVDALKKPPANGATPPDPALLQDNYRVLSKRRAELMAGMSMEEKKGFGQQLSPFVQRIGPVLMRYRLDKTRERLKNVVPPKPAPPEKPEAEPTEPPDASLSEDDLLDRLKGAANPGAPNAPAEPAPEPQ